jgi:AraC-like DNA-binding protein
MNRVQILAGCLSDLSPSTLVVELPSLVAGLPDLMSPAEQLLATGVLCQTLLRIARQSGLEEHVRVVNAIVRLNEPALGAEWRTRWVRAVESCARAFAMTGWADHVWTASGQKGAAMLNVLDRQFTDPAFGVKNLAAAVDLSPSHTVRLLKQSTGVGLLHHLRNRRIARARQLLATTPLRVKEVAAAAGYSSTSHFCRQFKRTCGITPAGYRVNRQTFV